MPASDGQVIKYQVIKDYLVKHIAEKKLLVNDRIPSEPELAKIFGVSSITVRRALFELVNEKRIYRIKGKGSFVADCSADAIRSRRLTDQIVGFVLSAKQGTYDSSLMKMTRGIQSYLTRHGYSLIIEYSDESLQREKQIIERLIDTGINGLIYFSTDPDKSLSALKHIHSKNIPFVLIDRYARSFPANYVVSDNFGSVYRAVEYLQSLGHGQIAFITYAGCSISSETDRLQGYRKAMENAGLPVYEDMILNHKQIYDKKFLVMILNREITAAVAVNDLVAIELMELCTKNNIRVPEEISVLGFDDVEQAAYQTPPLTSIRQYFDIMGKEAAKTLVRSLENPEIAIRKIELSTRLVLRNSVKANEKYSIKPD